MSQHLSLLLRPQMLHVPDGFLSTPMALTGWAIAVLIIAYALRQSRDQLGERQIPLLGVLAAFVFAAQAINFPVAGGTSGHLLGGALTAIVLGPWAAVLVMTAVIGVQGLLFQDGGLLVMGWNIINMGVLTAFAGALVYRLMTNWLGEGRSSLVAGGLIGAWLSVEAGAIATAVELVASGTSTFGLALPAMVAVHALIGVGEAIITVGALLLIYRTRPDILRVGETAPGQTSAGWLTVGLLISLALAVFSFAASGSPDGLERVAEEQGFLASALDSVYRLLPDYTIPFIENELISGVVAVVLGTLLVFAVVFLIGRIVRRPSSARR